MGEAKFEEISWEEVTKKGFDIALNTRIAKMINTRLPSGFELVYRDGSWWLKVSPTSRRTKRRGAGT